MVMMAIHSLGYDFVHLYALLGDLACIGKVVASSDHSFGSHTVEQYVFTCVEPAGYYETYSSKCW